jgi:chitin disaccharide deacetylase
MRALIVNADDFGLCREVNEGVITAFDHGIVTSTSLMVRQPAAEEAAVLAALRPALSVGLHVDLAEWVPEGEYDWVLRYQFVDVSNADAVTAEITHQLELFERMIGRAPTHIDGHQHVQRDDVAGGPLRAAAGRLGVPLRFHDPRVAYCGEFYGQDARGRPYPEGTAVDHLIAVLAALPDGCTELACHPGLGVTLEQSSYAAERDRELAALCDPAVIRTVRASGIGLASFADLAVRN